MTPVSHALSILKRLRDEAPTSGLIVGYSGGKDSMAVLSLALHVFGPDDIVCCHFYIIPDLEYERWRLNVARNLGVRKVISLPHPDVSTYVRNSAHRPADTSKYQTQRRHLWRDMERVAFYRTDIHWIAYGHRKHDSMFRRGMLNQTDDGIWWPYHKLYPLLDWKPKDVISYLKVRGHRIPLEAPDNVMGTNGIGFDPTFLNYLEAKFPGDYHKLLNVFPFARHLQYQADMQARHAIHENA